MNDTTTSTGKRCLWLAVLLSIVMPGVGHVYAGRLTRGLAFGLLYGVAIPVVLGLLAYLSPVSTLLFAFLMVVATFGVVIAAATDAYGVITRAQGDYVPKAFNHPAVYILIGLMIQGSSVGYALHVRDSLFEAFRIPTASEYPNITPGDRILADKQAYRRAAPEVGDVVVFHPPTDQWRFHWLKRVVAVGGDTVEMRDGILYVNGIERPRRRIGPATAEVREADGSLCVLEGEVYEETNGDVSYRIFLTPPSHESVQDMAEITVPEDHCFLLGGNRNGSFDSRQFGPIPYAVIEGRADYIYWPAKRWSRFGRLR